HSFFLTATATSEIYTLSLHDALPISRFPVRCRSGSGIGPWLLPNRSSLRPCSHREGSRRLAPAAAPQPTPPRNRRPESASKIWRSEEHTSELQSRSDLVCRLLLEKKK